MFSKLVAFLTVGKLKSFVACIYFMERPQKAIFSHLLKSPTDAGMGGEGALGWTLGSFHEFLQRTWAIELPPATLYHSKSQVILFKNASTDR